MEALTIICSVSRDRCLRNLPRLGSSRRGNIVWSEQRVLLDVLDRQCGLARWLVHTR